MVLKRDRVPLELAEALTIKLCSTGLLGTFTLASFAKVDIVSRIVLKTIATTNVRSPIDKVIERGGIRAGQGQRPPRTWRPA